MTITGQLTISDALRDEGMARVTAASDEADIRRIDGWIDHFNQSGDAWSANLLRDVVGDTARPQLIGARVRSAAMRGLMVRVGYTPSTLPSTHSHPIAVWRGTP